MDAQELQNSEKVPTVWVKNLNSILNEINNTKSSMIDMKPNNVIKLDIVEQYKSERYPKENVLPEYGLYRHLYQTTLNHLKQLYIFYIFFPIK